MSNNLNVLVLDFIKKEVFMNKKELLLKTVFCCMACDGEIADSEISLVKKLTLQSNSFGDVDVEQMLNSYVEAINQNGLLFISQYIQEIKDAEFTDEEALNLISLALKTIEADENIEYSEVRFFKKIRSQLKISDKKILNILPDKEDFLLPDIVEDDYNAFQTQTFSLITL